MYKLLFMLFAFVCSASAYAEAPAFKKNRAILKLKPGQEISTFKGIKGSHHLFGNLYIVKVDDALNFKKTFNDHPAVDYIELDYFAGKKALPKGHAPLKIQYSDDKGTKNQFNDPKVGKIWSFRDSEDNGISVNKAYERRSSLFQKEIIVAVVDTGVDFNHVDLKDSMWINTKEIPNNGIDDDQNGYIDDIYGINTLVRDTNGNATVNMKDAHGHGTHVSGTIAATQNNNIGIAGIASKVKIMGIRTVPNNSDETDVDVIEAFVYAAKNGAKIINCSFGKAHNEGGMAVSETIEHIGKKYGVLVVAASGNSTQNIDITPSYPASFPNDNLLVVASTTGRGSMSFFSNYGKKNVDIAAPGSSIYSLKPNNGYTSMSGTSMAAPTTTGVAAEVLSFHPHLTPVELKKILMNSAIKVRRFSSKVASGGRVDLDEALKLADQ